MFFIGDSVADAACQTDSDSTNTVVLSDLPTALPLLMDHVNAIMDAKSASVLASLRSLRLQLLTDEVPVLPEVRTDVAGVDAALGGPRVTEDDGLEALRAARRDSITSFVLLQEFSHMALGDDTDVVFEEVPFLIEVIGNEAENCGLLGKAACIAASRGSGYNFGYESDDSSG